jgi:hypothetical protein
MSAIKMTVHRLEQNGTCSLSGKEGEVLVVSFDDGTLNEGALSQKSLMQLLRMKLGQNGTKPVPKPAANGPAQAVSLAGVSAPPPVAEARTAK